MKLIKVEPCRGCGRIILLGKIANLTVKCDPAPLTNVGDIVKLLTSSSPPTLWVVEKNRQGRPTHFRSARPGEVGPVVEHVCTVKAAEAVLRPPAPGGGETVPPKAPRPPVAPSRPSSGPSTGPSGVRGAEPRRSKPTCDRCGKPCADGTYASIEVGQLPVWAEHVNRKDCRP